jgi:hypothetical protein
MTAPSVVLLGPVQRTCHAIVTRARHIACSLADLVVAERDRMHARFAGAKAIQVAIGVADLDRAHAEARSIAAKFRRRLRDPGAAWREIGGAAPRARPRLEP